MTPTSRVSAESRITFDDQPVVTSRTRGITYGHRFRLSGVTLVVSAVTLTDGTVSVGTEIRPEISACVLNLDGINNGDWRHARVSLEQLPAHVRCIHDSLVSTVHALHPGLRYADSPLAQQTQTGVPA